MLFRNEFSLELARDSNKPIYLCLAASIIREIEQGRLKSGERLPGTRILAKNLGLHRNTVDAAYHELTMQGWLVAQSSRGTFVADDLPDFAPIAPINPPSSRPSKREIIATRMLNISDGTPDPRLVPRSELIRAFRHALGTPAFLSGASYVDPRGTTELRMALAETFFDARGVSISPDEIMITHGSQMGLFLAASALLKPSDVIAVENPGYPYAWAAFRATGAKIIGIPVDEDGIDVEKLAIIAEETPALQAVYVTPHHQYPTTVTLGMGRRLRLLEIARQHNLTLIEDDYDHEYRFDSKPILPLVARAYHQQPFIHLGSFSKLLAPTIRLGYVIAPPDIMARMMAYRESIDRQGDIPLELALASMIENGDLGRHSRKARRVYAARRDVLAEELKTHLGDAFTFTIPAGGLAIWLRLRDGLNAQIWAEGAAERGLRIKDGQRFSLDDSYPLNYFRFGYAHLNEDEIRHAVSLLLQSCPNAID
ncbi:MAG: PLP-dependent aminotransferase family protein [Zymomonas mobilis]|uniref:MocR-like pyridoxine biosynthesis transcription factor PdxR n=1 Tax=Zymomonas mobilis TaxID=542 RepID=UPI0039ECD2DD